MGENTTCLNSPCSSISCVPLSHSNPNSVREEQTREVERSKRLEVTMHASTDTHAHISLTSTTHHDSTTHTDDNTRLLPTLCTPLLSHHGRHIGYGCTAGGCIDRIRIVHNRHSSNRSDSAGADRDRDSHSTEGRGEEEGPADREGGRRS